MIYIVGVFFIIFVFGGAIKLAMFDEFKER